MNDARPNLLSRAAADLFPGYFALVMATGIISIACFLLGMKTISLGLLVINVIAYVVLLLLLLVRLLFFFSRVRADIKDHVRGPGFFTVFAGIGLWIVIMYAFFTAVTVSENKPSIEAALNGGWLLAVVATQSKVCFRS